MGVLLGVALNYAKSLNPSSSILTYGFGAVHFSTLIHGWALESLPLTQRVIAAILVANTPQLILSFLYFALNGLCTSMLLAHEWSAFAHERKGLRVSAPVKNSAQSPTHYLSLPFRYAIPLALGSFGLHYLVSQSIFLAYVTENDVHGQPMQEPIDATCGFSPLAMVLTLVAVCVVLVVLVGLAMRRFKPGTPLVGSCSLAIAAACHPPEEEEGSSLLKLQWGVVGLPGLDRSSVPVGEDGRVEHCSFSSKRVSMPVAGMIYA